MASIRLVDPFRCRMWHMHDRLEQYVNEETCRSEVSSFEKHGQLIPVLGRPLQSDADHDVELIYGARRLFVARLLNVQLKVELRQISDREAIVAMDIENRQRADISPYERGASYASWLREGHFQSQDDIARTLKLSASQVSRLLKLARLPSVVVESFSSASDICEGWGLDLIEALSDTRRRQPLIDAARSIGRMASRPPAREVYRRLVVASSGGRGKKLKPPLHDEVVRGGDGAPLFRIRHQTKSIALPRASGTRSLQMRDGREKVSARCCLARVSPSPQSCRKRITSNRGGDELPDASATAQVTRATELFVVTTADT